MAFILARKLNMSQRFTTDGVKIPVTVLEVGPSKVTQVKTVEHDGYSAVQTGFGAKKKLNKAASGHQKNGKFQYLREFRVDSKNDFKVGQEVSASGFEPGMLVKVSGVMKGRGFTGAMKRHGFHGFPASHGHNRPRSVGSIGSRFPQHTLKGMRMAGRMGGHQVTVANLMVVDVDLQNNLLLVSGAVPGSRGGLVKIESTGKKKMAPVLYGTQNKPDIDKK